MGNDGSDTKWHFPGVPPKEGQKLAQAAQRPEGTAAFRANSPDLLDTAVKSGILVEVVVGQIVFRLFRDENMILRFLHSAPSVGAREATVDLKELTDKGSPDQFFIALSWSPAELRLNFGRDGGDQLLEGVGQPIDASFQVMDGQVIQIGDVGVQVQGARLYSGGKQQLGPTAIKLWEDSLLATETLLSGQSEEGYIFENVIANASLSALVTGFEGYCKERFSELESEGVVADFGKLVHSFLSREEKDKFDRGEELHLQVVAKGLGVSQQRAIVGRINFQSYDNAKTAFSRGYGLTFANLDGITSDDLGKLKKLISYRHRIIHVSPLLGLLNGPESPPDEPVFANRATAEPAIELFKKFITALHQKTLELR